ncbi:MAG: DUF2244 domain-containing protein [Rhodomicrobium sp.]
MTGNPERTIDSGAPVLRFTATLLPHRSLSRKGFVALMLTIGAVSILSGIVFIAMGAWPVTGFFGLETLLCYAAFRRSYRTGRLCEKIELSERELRLTRLHPSGKAESWNFNPYWVRFEHRPRENAADELSLTSHGRKLIFGAFLSDGEKASLATALGAALARQNSYSTIHCSEI